MICLKQHSLLRMFEYFVQITKSFKRTNQIVHLLHAERVEDVPHVLYFVFIFICKIRNAVKVFGIYKCSQSNLCFSLLALLFTTKFAFLRNRQKVLLNIELERLVIKVSFFIPLPLHEFCALVEGLCVEPPHLSQNRLDYNVPPHLRARSAFF